MNNCRICRTGTLARLMVGDGQECPSYYRFATVASWLIVRVATGPYFPLNRTVEKGKIGPPPGFSLVQRGRPIKIES